MYHESTQHAQNCFLTLTYRDAPPTLCKRDLQLFFKRLRKLVPVRYFACGEYGTITHRPHYHAIIFGADFLGGSFKVNEKLHSHPKLQKAWGHGFVSCGDVTIESCMYVAGYVNKKIGNPDTFNTMSLRPGIGHTWLDKYSDDIRRTGTIAINGREFPIPKRYLQWRETEFEQLKKERAAYFRNLTPEQVCSRRAAVHAQEAIYKSKLELQREHL